MAGSDSPIMPFRRFWRLSKARGHASAWWGVNDGAPPSIEDDVFSSFKTAVAASLDTSVIAGGGRRGVQTNPLGQEGDRAGSYFHSGPATGCALNLGTPQRAFLPKPGRSRLLNWRVNRSFAPITIGILSSAVVLRGTYRFSPDTGKTDSP